MLSHRGPRGPRRSLPPSARRSPREGGPLPVAVPSAARRPAPGRASPPTKPGPRHRDDIGHPFSSISRPIAACVAPSRFCQRSATPPPRARAATTILVGAKAGPKRRDIQDLGELPVTSSPASDSDSVPVSSERRWPRTRRCPGRSRTREGRRSPETRRPRTSLALAVRAAVVDAHEPVGYRHPRAPQQNRVDGGENQRVRAHAKRQGDHDDRGESRGAGEHPRA